MAGSILASRSVDIPTDSGVAEGISPAVAPNDPRIKAEVTKNVAAGFLTNGMNVILLCLLLWPVSLIRPAKRSATTALWRKVYLAAASSVT